VRVFVPSHRHGMSLHQGLGYLSYGVAAVSRIDENVGLFCKRAL